MKSRILQTIPVLRRVSVGWLIAGLAAVLAVAAWASADSWWPPTKKWLIARLQEPDAAVEEDAGKEDDHAHGRDDDSIEISRQARENIGLETGEVKLRKSYPRRITVPAVVVERSGKTRFKIAAPMTGVVTGIYVVRGEAVRSGDLLFKVRLTHEDLVQAQTDFLRTLGQLDVEEQEIRRLKKIEGGAVAGRVILEREYERDKLLAVRRAQSEALLLHGLSTEQVERIAQSRRLIREVKVIAPFVHRDSSLHDESAEPPPEPAALTGTTAEPGEDSHQVIEQRYVVEDLPAHTGEVVKAGQPLCVLADYSRLYVEGHAFEQDAGQLHEAARREWGVTAMPEITTVSRTRNDPAKKTSKITEKPNPQAGTKIEDLKIVYVANEVDRRSRALHFYVELPNEPAGESKTADGREFITWRYKPGQRMQLRVPVEMFQDVIVLPVDAVAEEGAEFYVFVQSGGRFQRRPVHVMHRDQFEAVIAYDGSLYPGDVVAVNSAHQLLLALKKKAGEGGGGHGHAHHGHVH